MAEKEYINRDKVLESISGLTWYSKNKKGVLNIGAVNREEAYYPAENVFDAVESVPAADVVEVVRCKDCKHWRHDTDGMIDHYECAIFCGCYGRGYLTNADDFCSYGERKEK